jgi:hypothetical protein
MQIGIPVVEPAMPLGQSSCCGDLGIVLPVATESIDGVSLGLTYPEAGRLLNQASPVVMPPDVVYESPKDSSSWRWIAGISSLVGAAGLAYHGYKRSKGSVPASIGWGILGAIFPINFVAGGVAAAQGFGKKRRKR